MVLKIIRNMYLAPIKNLIFKILFSTKCKMDKIIDTLPKLAALDDILLKLFYNYIEKLDVNLVPTDFHRRTNSYFKKKISPFYQDSKVNTMLRGYFYASVICHYYLQGFCTKKF